jgi:hypothetical protein
MSKVEQYLDRYRSKVALMVGSIASSIAVATQGFADNWQYMLVLGSVAWIITMDIRSIKDQAKLDGIDIEKEIANL